VRRAGGRTTLQRDRIFPVQQPKLFAFEFNIESFPLAYSTFYCAPMSSTSGIVYRNFRVVSANNANTRAPIQKRTMILDSLQPIVQSGGARGPF